jgi:predicted transcriptional regulator
MAPRKQSDRRTPLETEIMNVLWELSPVTVQTVRERLERELAYTTVEQLARLRRMLKGKEAGDGNY